MSSSASLKNSPYSTAKSTEPSSEATVAPYNVGLPGAENPPQKGHLLGTPALISSIEHALEVPPAGLTNWLPASKGPPQGREFSHSSSSNSEAPTVGGPQSPPVLIPSIKQELTPAGPTNWFPAPKRSQQAIIHDSSSSCRSFIQNPTVGGPPPKTADFCRIFVDRVWSEAETSKNRKIPENLPIKRVKDAPSEISKIRSESSMQKSPAAEISRQSTNRRRSANPMNKKTSSSTSERLIMDAKSGLKPVKNTSLGDQDKNFLSPVDEGKIVLVLGSVLDSPPVLSGKGGGRKAAKRLQCTGNNYGLRSAALRNNSGAPLLGTENPQKTNIHTPVLTPSTKQDVTPPGLPAPEGSPQAGDHGSAPSRNGLSNLQVLLVSFEPSNSVCSDSGAGGSLLTSSQSDFISCAFCCDGKLFDRGSLKGHISSSHIDYLPVRCTVCEAQFPLVKEVLENHGENHEEWNAKKWKMYTKKKDTLKEALLLQLYLLAQTPEQEIAKFQTAFAADSLQDPPQDPSSSSNSFAPTGGGPPSAD